MPLRTPVVLAIVLLLACNLASADAVMVTRAMTASTIMEVFIEEDAVWMELEIGEEGLAAIPHLAAALAQAKSGPIAIPRDAELSIDADGRGLPGSIEQVTPRKRIERDEVSGEPLPNPAAEEVLFARLRYPLRSKPRELVLHPPKTPDGYGTIDIGFVAYHHGVAVNDFRYLAVSEPLKLDWADPFYSRFERRTLKRKYDSPMNIFLYVEPFEVRKEFVVRPLDLARFMDLDVEANQPIPPDTREELLAKIAAFLEDRAPVTIDGKQPKPILDRIHFLKRGLRMTRVVTPDEPIDGTSAIIGAIYVYPVDGVPKDVKLDWDLFDERIARVPGSATDEAGPMPSILTPTDRELHWVNYLKGATLPGELEVASPESHLSISIVFIITAMLAMVLLFFAYRRRSWILAIAAIALLGADWFPLPLGSVEVPVPASVRPPSGEEASPTIHALLYNIYRALDFRDEEVVFDRLSQTLSGDVLERVYLEMRKGLRLENQGGARVRVREVEILDVIPEDTDSPDTLRYRTRWNATGSVGHWGHTHMRTNQYAALVTLGKDGDRWKIADIDILEEQRLNPATQPAR